MCVTWSIPADTMPIMLPTTAGPRDPHLLDPVPYGRTARRLDYWLLPPTLRRLVEDRFGTAVVEAVSSEVGFTPGLVSVLTGADGRRMLLKAASIPAQRPFASAFVAEARTLRRLPARPQVPRLLWTHEDDLWVLLALEHVDGVAPSRPWRPDQLDRCLDALEDLAAALTPPPTALRAFHEDLGGLVSGWEHVRSSMPDWPHLEEAAALAARVGTATLGTTLVHTDVSDASLVLAHDGRTVLGDWHAPVVGAAWIDTLSLLLAADGDGLDADTLLAERALTRDVPPDDIDTVLALFCGWFLERRDQPGQHSSPYLRRHQDWCGQAAWAWLARRRGWT